MIVHARTLNLIARANQFENRFANTNRLDARRKDRVMAAAQEILDLKVAGEKGPRTGQIKLPYLGLGSSQSLGFVSYRGVGVRAAFSVPIGMVVVLIGILREIGVVS
jgi:hypothetical protein